MDLVELAQQLQLKADAHEATATAERRRLAPLRMAYLSIWAHKPSIPLGRSEAEVDDWRDTICGRIVDYVAILKVAGLAENIAKLPPGSADEAGSDSTRRSWDAAVDILKTAFNGGKQAVIDRARALDYFSWHSPFNLDDIHKLILNPNEAPTDKAIGNAPALQDHLICDVQELCGETAQPVIVHATGSPESRQPTTAATEEAWIVCHGGGNYSIGDSGPKPMTKPLDDCLRAFIGYPALTAEGLREVEIKRPLDLLKRIKKVHDGIFAPAIELHGKKGHGYTMRVKKHDPLGSNP